MGAAQTTYAAIQPAGAVGMIADMQNSNRISRTASGNITFGQPVLRVGNHNCILASLETLESLTGGVALAGNVGNGVMGAVTVSAGAKEGVYLLRIISVAANAGNFELEDPDGNLVGIGTVAVAFNKGGIAFTLADGATDFSLGDGFSITVIPSVATNDLDLLGLSIRDPSLNHDTVDRYEQYDSVSIMDWGTMYVTAGATVVAGDPVYWIAASGKYTNVAGAGNLLIRNCRFELGAVDTALVIVKLGSTHVVNP